MGKLLEWHKRWWSDEPFIGWNYVNDGQGNSDFRMFIGGSKFWHIKGKPLQGKKKEEIEKQDLYIE